MKKLAHRGYSERYPENTMIAFKKAIERGFDGMETDVHLTLDGQLVLCHDESIDRTSNGTGYIKDMTLEQLREYNFHYNSEYNEKIPTLEELLLLIKDTDLLLNIELKTDCFHYEGIEQKVYDLVKKIGVQDQIMYSSFYLPSLLKMREIDDNVYVGYLYYKDIDTKHDEVLEHNFKYVHPDYKLLDTSVMKFYNDHNIKLAVWTIKTQEEYYRMKDYGIDVVISNDYMED